MAKQLDFNSLEDTRAFVQDILKSETRLDVLINNAASTVNCMKLSKDGILRGLQINYFGPFLLTVLLTGKLKYLNCHSDIHRSKKVRGLCCTIFF